MSDIHSQSNKPIDLLVWCYSVVRTRTRQVIILFVVTAILAVVVSLLMPVWYKSSARLIMPDNSGLSGGLASMLGNLSPTAARFLGGGTASRDYDRYLSLLTSDSMMDTVIDEFDLVSVYKKQRSKWPRFETRRMLRQNSSFDVDEKYNYLSISMEDRDPQRAADIANFFVEELNRRNADLVAQDAGRFRQYVEGRYYQVVADLDSAQVALQHLQEELGIIELPMTIEAVVTGMAQQSANMLQAEMQYNMLLSQYGENNPQVLAARAALQSARRAEQSVMQGTNSLLPIPMADMPEALNRYATAYRNVLLQGELLKVAQPMYEQARFDEERERVAVQVIDFAEVPERKARPKRAFVVIGTVFSVMAMYITYILTVARIQAVRREQLATGV